MAKKSIGHDKKEQEKRYNAAKAMFVAHPNRSVNSVRKAFEKQTGYAMNTERLKNIREEVLNEVWADQMAKKPESLEKENIKKYKDDIKQFKNEQSIPPIQPLQYSVVPEPSFFDPLWDKIDSIMEVMELPLAIGLALSFFALVAVYLFAVYLFHR